MFIEMKFFFVWYQKLCCLLERFNKLYFAIYVLYDFYKIVDKASLKY